MVAWGVVAIVGGWVGCVGCMDVVRVACGCVWLRVGAHASVRMCALRCYCVGLSSAACVSTA
jgi:hypothetical protein